MLLVYPNPAANKLYLTYSRQVLSFQISDITGRVLLKNTKYSSDSGINISELKAGIYFLSVTGNKKKYITKFYKE
jgi:hypothetical protein